MCVAIVKKPNGKITDEVLAACYKANDDGAGFAYYEGGKVVVDKGYFDFDKFLEAFRAAEARVGDKSNMLIHFRISTGGTKTALNCHPFEYDHGALIHNGYLFAVYGEKSDTNLFTERLGKNFTKEGVAQHKAAMEKLIGQGNKLAMLFKDGEYAIINEEQGSWIDNVWFSNCFWKSRVVTRVVPGPQDNQNVFGFGPRGIGRHVANGGEYRHEVG
jgi:predicted glutamine amidotransferase